jgi:hypothetical protein
MFVEKIELYMKYMEQIKKYVMIAREIFLSVQNVEPYTSKTTMKMVTIMDFAEENVLIKDKTEELIIR